MANEQLNIVASEVFEHPQFGHLRTMTDEKGETWFVGKAVAEALGYKNPTEALREHVAKDDAIVLKYRAYSKTLKASAIWQGNDYSDKLFINESGLYSLVLSSKLAQARAFKHWVTSEVLPQIRQNGGYMMVTPEMSDEQIKARIELLVKKAIESKQRLLNEARELLDAQRPLVRFALEIQASDTSILIGDLAQLLTQNGYEIGRTRLFSWMRHNGYLFKNCRRPIQHWVEKGLFELDEQVVQTCYGPKISVTTRVTPLGQRYFLEKFLGR